MNISRKHETGATLVYVLGLLGVSAILVGILIRQIRFDHKLVLRRQALTQAGFLAQAGGEYALSRFGGKTRPPKLDLSVQNISYRLPDPKLSFLLDVGSLGLFGLIRSQGRAEYPGWPGHRTLIAWAGDPVDLRAWPALGLLNRAGNLALAGKADIRGPVLLWRGGVQKELYGDIRFTGDMGHQGAVWDSTSPLWRQFPFDIRRGSAWMAMVDDVCRNSTLPRSLQTYFDSTILIVPDSATLQDTTFAGTTIIGKGRLLLGGGFLCRECRIFSREIHVAGSAQFEDAVVSATGSVRLTGEARIQGGQFLAGDSLILELQKPLSGFPLFYSHGHRIPGDKDSAYSGALWVKKAQGEGLFFAQASGKPLFNSPIVDLVLGSSTDLRGFAYCAGVSALWGRFEGSVLTEDMSFQYDGTIYKNHLKDAELRAWSRPSSPVLPLCLPNSPVGLLRKRVL